MGVSDNVQVDNSPVDIKEKRHSRGDLPIQVSSSVGQDSIRRQLSPTPGWISAFLVADCSTVPGLLRTTESNVTVPWQLIDVDICM